MPRHQLVPSCTTPCKGFAEQPTWKPCLVLDLRCELATPVTGGNGQTWDKDFIDCGLALETAIRKIHPEFPP